MKLRQSEFVLIPQAAELIGISPYLLRQSIQHHGLPVVSLPGGATRIRRTELEAWLDAQQQTQAVSA